MQAPCEAQQVSQGSMARLSRAGISGLPTREWAAPVRILVAASKPKRSAMQRVPPPAPWAEPVAAEGHQQLSSLNVAWAVQRVV
jgi:hypothetical protein